MWPETGRERPNRDRETDHDWARDKTRDTKKKKKTNERH